MERFDLYDSRRRFTGRTIARGEDVPDGLRRLVVHVCVFNQKGEMLIQQRQPFKEGWPNLWDVSVGGGVQAGESTQQAAQRELQEELGLEFDFENETPMLTTTFRKGFDDLYIIHLEPDLDTLRLQPEEVQAVRWAGRDEVLAMIENGTFIPYSRPFMEYVFFRHDHWGNFDTDK